MSNLAQNWWMLTLRGVLAVLFGVLAYSWPGVTAASFVVVFGAYALVDGVTCLAAALRPPPGASRAWLVVGGVVGVLAALVVFTMPGLSALVLFYVVATWAVATGVAQILAAVQLRKLIDGEWLLALSGLLSVALGIYMYARPLAGLLGLIWAIAIYAVVSGVALIILSLRLRSWWKGQGETYGGAHGVAA